MKYIVEVGEPVPSNLDEIASKVAASFNISDAKAMALLRRAPGAMTKAVSEREADVVAGIFERAGLNVVKRPVEESGDVPARAGPAAHDPMTPPAEGGLPASAPPPVEGDEGVASSGAWSGTEPSGAAAFGEAAASGEVPAHPERSGDEDVWDQPLGATEHEPVDRFSHRDDFEERAADIGWEGGEWEAPSGAARDAMAAADASAPAEGAVVSRDEDEAIDVEMGTPPEERPAAEEDGVPLAPVEPVDAAEQPEPDQRRRGERRDRRDRRQREKSERPAARGVRPEAGGRGAERGGDEVRLRRGGVRRGIAWLGVLPSLLALLGMGVAMLVMLVPVARDQQAARAADAAAAQAASLEALTGGLPLTAQTLSGALVDLSNNGQALLQPNGVSLMVVTDPNGAPLAGWYGTAKTPAALPPATRQAVSASALAALAGQPPAPAPTFAQRLRYAWNTVEAMVGRGSAPTVLRAAAVTGGGQAVGAVVVGVPPVSGDSALVTAFETVLLIGLVPLLIGILMAGGLADGLRRKVQYLLQAADRISRGDLDESVSLRSRDELGQLARAIERMRVSLSTLLEHRRRHR